MIDQPRVVAALLLLAITLWLVLTRPGGLPEGVSAAGVLTLRLRDG